MKGPGLCKILQRKKIIPEFSKAFLTESKTLRSHCFVFLNLYRYEGGNVRSSRFQFVDLAGSERIKEIYCFPQIPLNLSFILVYIEKHLISDIDYSQYCGGKTT